MAPMTGERDLDGYWGPPTATIDWCEANYEVSYYVAEFWNTVSNIVMIVPPLIGSIIAWKDRLEARIFWCHITLMAVGLGSWCFHGTLLYEMQVLEEQVREWIFTRELIFTRTVPLLDELPMIWGSAFLLYTLMETDSAPKRHNRRLQIGLLLYCVFVTYVYMMINQPVFHEAAYGILVISMIGYSIRILRNFEHSFPLFISGFGSYAIGFLIWNLDNLLCKNIRDFRQTVAYPLKPLFQGHAWWHVLAGVGTYLGLVFATDARLKFLKRDHKIKMKMGFFPFVRSASSI